MSFLDEITKLTNPAASLPDVEDDNYDGTLAKTQQKSNGVAVASRPKKFEEIDFEHGKYAGEAVSRRDFFGDVNEISDLKQNAADSDGSDEEIDEEDDVEDEEDNDNSDDEIEGNEEKNSGITHVSLPTEEADSSDNKAECVENQQKIWDDLMYINIRMHALLNVSNQMPRGEARKLLLQSADEKTKENMAEALKNMGKIRKLLKKTVECFEENENDEDDDEEIPSDEDIGELNSENEDEDDEEDDEDDDEGKNIEASKSVDQGVSVGGLANFLKKHDEEYDKFRSATITKWYNRTKLLNTKSANNADFSVFEKGNVITQIKKILNDDQKLLRKVRTNRSGKQRLGRKEENESIDDEIFDDTDFYQILLKQMIESKSNITKNSDDKADMTRSYIELQQLFKNKKKRDVTSLSSKDRKLKYEPIAKLINFYPANPSVVTWTHESRNELFKSLFS